MDISQVELIILAALGATFTWGTTAFLSLDCTFFVPFIASWILGAVLGDYKTGLIVGATIQTINMAPVMVGGMTAMDIWGATAICVPLVIRGGMDLSTALTIAAPIAVLYNILGTLVGVVWLDGVGVGIVDKLCHKGDWKHLFIFNAFIAGIPKWIVLCGRCHYRCCQQFPCLGDHRNQYCSQPVACRRFCPVPARHRQYQIFTILLHWVLPGMVLRHEQYAGRHPGCRHWHHLSADT